MMPELKPYTLYQCLECGKSSRWTGAYHPEHRSPADYRCSACGAELVEDVDDGHRWRVSFELVHPHSHPDLYYGDRVMPGVDAADLDDSYWSPVSRETSNEHGARQQYDGLAAQMAAGELIRNVRLEVSTTAWELVAGGESS